MCFVLESLGAFQTYCSLPPWPLSQIFAVGTEWGVCVNYSFFTVFIFWRFYSRDLLLLGVYPSQYWAIFRESVNKSTQSPPGTAAFIRLSYANLLVHCSDPSTKTGNEGSPSSRAWHHFVNQASLGLLGSASSYPLAGSTGRLCSATPHAFWTHPCDVSPRGPPRHRVPLGLRDLWAQMACLWQSGFDVLLFPWFISKMSPLGVYEVTQRKSKARSNRKTNSRRRMFAQAWFWVESTTQIPKEGSWPKS